MYHPKVGTKKIHQSKVELQEIISERERERERTYFFGREYKINNKII